MVGLVELTRRQAAALAADAGVRARFRTVLLRPEAGRAILSRYPVLDSDVRTDPAARRDSGLLRARLDLGAGRTLTAVSAHPLPALAAPSSSLPLSYRAAPRDAEIAFVRSVVDADIRLGQRVVLMGDFNVSDREPAAATLVRGLTDAQAAVGWGYGASWAPVAFRRRGVALVRIDRVLAGPGVVPTAVRTDCGWYGSDHCLLRATVAVAPG